MADEQNPYAAVLADLERERDQINAAITMIKRRMGLSTEDGQVPSAVASSVTIGEGPEIRSDTFFGMTISDAIKKYLGMVKKPQRASEIAKALDRGGLLHSAKSWLPTVQTTLGRMKGTVVRVPNGWGLTEWYPGRNFAKVGKTAETKRGKRKRVARRTNKAPKTPQSESVKASQKLQVEYMTLMRKIPKDRREAYKNVARQEGRESAVKAMKRALVDEQFR